MEQKPNFAIRAMIIKDGQVLLGKSIQGDSQGKYAFPGGHLRYLESFKDCVIREVKEECGIEIENVRVPAVTNMIESHVRHNVHITLLADFKSGEATVMEPEKYESWEWYDIDDLPSPLVKNCELSIENYKNGTNYFDLENQE